ncbi:hypothetical protein HPB50_025290 [Hyalomma asiaticum]|uniref:Uncharacterized protein n=1 Tax=Hyalomma asiaticum TaxID=266040 RepID=A0ACB7RWC7_HYAAI|nr:hypothetical protein HPB50_025290 [Hyalomma asiaticum]
MALLNEAIIIINAVEQRVFRSPRLAALMDKRIRPWINKKIVEYIGEEEPTLVDFICSKVLAGSAAQSILNDVSMVLDEEAEVFVVKMWRLLIYEIEAKKVGLVK